MGSTTAAAAGAAAAAAVAAKRRQMMFAEEEEDVAKYTQGDLDNGWEFKIVRSESGAFRKMGILQKLIEEEARAGWVMLRSLMMEGCVSNARAGRVPGTPCCHLMLIPTVHNTVSHPLGSDCLP